MADRKPRDNRDETPARLMAERDRIRRLFALFAGLSRRLASSLDPSAVLREVESIGS